MRPRPHRSATAVLATVAAITSASAAHADLVAGFEIDATADRGPVNRDVLGADIEYIGQHTPAAIEPIAAGTPIARFPGGDDVAGFLWTDPAVGACAAPRFDWPGFAAMASRLGMGVLLETNAVRGTPESNAAWVVDARARGLRVPWVEIGNEVWGSWDAGFRTAAQYADDVRANAAAIRARTPDVGVVLEIGTSNEDAWNRAAVRATADVIDAVDYHYYPNHLSPADPLEVAAGADGVAPLMARLRAMLREEAPARADAIRIILGEWDGASDPPRPAPPPAGVAYCQWAMPDALFFGVAVGEMLSSGVAAAMFYELQGHRFGAVDGDACHAGDLGARRPKELALRLWRDHVGQRLVAVSAAAGGPTFHSAGPTQWDGFAGDAPVVRTYASLGDGGDSLRLVVVNRSADQPVDVALALRGFAPAPSAARYVLAGDAMMATNENVGGAADAVHTVAGTVAIGGPAFTYSAPAHSITALVLRRAAAASSVPDAGARRESAPPSLRTAASLTCHTASPGVRARASGWAVLATGLGLAWTRRRRRRA